MGNVGTVGQQYFFDSYFEIASNLLVGNGYVLTDGTTVIHRPPVYTYFMIPAAMFPDVAAKVFQFMHAVFGALSVWVTMSLSGVVASGSKKAKLYSGYVVALWPFLIWETKVSVPENLLVLLLPLAVFALLRLLQNGRLFYSLFFGLVCALISLCHASYFIPALIGIVILLFDCIRKKQFKPIIVVVTIFVCVVLPWMQRNIALGLESYAPASGFGLHYFKGWFYFERLFSNESYFEDLEQASTNYVNALLAMNDRTAINSDKERSNVEKNNFLDAKARDHIKSNLFANVIKSFVKAPLMWVRQQSVGKVWLNVLFLFPLFLGALVGVKRLKPVHRITFFLMLFCSSLGFGFVFIECAPMRYALPFLPLLAVLAASATSKSALEISK